MGANRISQTQIDRYWLLRREGFSINRAAREVQISESSAKRLEGKPANGQDYKDLRAAKNIPDTPIPLDELCDEAKAALADRTGYLWCKRYFGIELSPWQMQSWEVMEDLFDSPDREFGAENAPPGGGKSTKLVAFASKRIAVNRALRVLFICRAHSLAERNTMRLRRALERSTPAVGADSTLSADFGRFKPKQGGDVWKRDEFVVEQMDGTPIEEKEPTCSAFGFDSEWLGNRIELVLGDDLDSTRSTRNMEIVEKNREVFDNELEPRLEPGGLFFLAQQRLGAFDFSAHVLSKVILPADDGGDEDQDGTLQYRHIIFKAHYEDKCQGRETHKTGAPAWPEGCLLDPNRLPWRDVRKAMNNLQRFKVVYQQEDASETDALVQRIWVDGGKGADGVDYLGCWDKNRGAWELPEGLNGCLGIITVDPSPTRYWSVQAWAVHLESEQRYLLDLHREKMDAPEFLDWSREMNCFTGLAEDWWHNFHRLGITLSHVIVEINAAQRFMLQYDFFKRWQSLRQVNIVPHSTHRNKSDNEFGIQMIGPKWKFGQVRLPGKQGDPGRYHAMRLVDEVLRWPMTATDDCVLGQWFLETNLDRLRPMQAKMPKFWRPSWLAA